MATDFFFSQKFGTLAEEKLRCGCRRGWSFPVEGWKKLLEDLEHLLGDVQVQKIL